MKYPMIGLMLAGALLAGCNVSTTTSVTPTEAEIAAIGEKANNDFISAINSNDLETLMAAVTEDVVIQAPGMPAVVGKPAAREWVAGYLGAVQTQWEKTSQEFKVSGDWAFQRYTYKVTDTVKATGEVTTDTGKGLVIYHRDADGVWRVARDTWNSDGPAAPTA